MISLIVNADDLGSSPQRDRGIFAAFAHGIVTSASLLANGRSFPHAAREALACKIPLGVHLNLSEGCALTGIIPGLTDSAGNFPGKTALRAILITGSLDASGIRRELLAQIERVRAAGLTPDHLDTHQHCLLFPALTGIIADMAEAAGIRALRLPFPIEAGGGRSGEAGCAASADDLSAPMHSPAERNLKAAPKGVHSPGAGSPPPAATSGLTLDSELAIYRQLAPTARATLQARNLWTPDGLWGMPLLNRLNEASLAATLKLIPAGTWELMTHPGYCDPDHPFGGPERETELAALTAPAIRQLIVARGIELTSFGVSACAC